MSIESLIILKLGIEKYQDILAGEVNKIDGPPKEPEWNNLEMEELHEKIFRDIDQIFEMGKEDYVNRFKNKYINSIHKEPCGRDELGVMTCDRCIYETYYLKELEEIEYKTEELLLSSV